jgi:hypothetical protein
MDRLAGKKPKRVPTAPLEQLLFNAMESAAMLRISETVFRRLVKQRLVQGRTIPGGVGQKPMRRYSRADLEKLIELL